MPVIVTLLPLCREYSCTAGGDEGSPFVSSKVTNDTTTTVELAICKLICSGFENGAVQVAKCVGATPAQAQMGP